MGSSGNQAVVSRRQSNFGTCDLASRIRFDPNILRSLSALRALRIGPKGGKGELV